MSDLAIRLANMPSDQRRATLVTLPSHLAQAAKAEQLQSLLTNFDFIQAKVSEWEPQQIIEDYDLAIALSKKKLESLRLIQGALQLSANILEEDETQLAGQLLGRLMSYNTPEIMKITEQAKQWKAVPWLRPLTPSLIKPSSSLAILYQVHLQVMLALSEQ